MSRVIVRLDGETHSYELLFIGRKASLSKLRSRQARLLERFNDLAHDWKEVKDRSQRDANQMLSHGKDLFPKDQRKISSMIQRLQTTRADLGSIVCNSKCQI